MDTFIMNQYSFFSTHNRDALYGRIPFRPLNTESEESCISCAISAARKVGTLLI